MIELLALPGWQASATTLEEWVARLSEAAGAVEVTRESSGVAWLEVRGLRLRGYAVIEAGEHVEAVNFELTAPDPGPAARAVAEAAAALGWEVHQEDEEEDDGEE
jgi:hypothetical protein